MELIFSFLPLPIAAVSLVAIAIGGVLVRKFVKSRAINAITDAVVAGTLTRTRIDQTVEAILAKLKVQPALADKIGDLIAEITLSVVGQRDVVATKAMNVAQTVLKDKNVVPAVATRLTSSPTLVNNLIVEIADPEVSGNDAARSLVAEGLITAYAAKRVL